MFYNFNRSYLKNDTMKCYNFWAACSIIWSSVRIEIVYTNATSYNVVIDIGNRWITSVIWLNKDFSDSDKFVAVYTDMFAPFNDLGFMPASITASKLCSSTNLTAGSILWHNLACIPKKTRSNFVMLLHFPIRDGIARLSDEKIFFYNHQLLF